MDSNLLERLLHEEESDSLDFKREQYLFEGATDAEKGELLKDILAFANSWRLTNAFILVGVSEERQGGRKKVIGANLHIDDAKLEEFVNAKTQKPITFSYEVSIVDDKEIGIFRIPVQERPFYLRKGFGGLKPNAVYIRRGSSTDEAEPEEIARMGAATAAARKEEVRLELQFGDFESRKGLGTEISVESFLLHRTASDWEFLDRSKQVGFYEQVTAFTTMANTDYDKQLYQYVEAAALIKPITFMFRNLSSVPAMDVRIEMVIPFKDSLTVLGPDDYPERPLRSFIRAVEPLSELLLQRQSPTSVTRHSNAWRVTVDIGKIHPKADSWCEYPFYIGSKESCRLDLIATIYADNLPIPVSVPLAINLRTKTRAITNDDLC